MQGAERSEELEGVVTKEPVAPPEPAQTNESESASTATCVPYNFNGLFTRWFGHVPWLSRLFRLRKVEDVDGNEGVPSSAVDGDSIVTVDGDSAPHVSASEGAVPSADEEVVPSADGDEELDEDDISEETIEGGFKIVSGKRSIHLADEIAAQCQALQAARRWAVQSKLPVEDMEDDNSTDLPTTTTTIEFELPGAKKQDLLDLKEWLISPDFAETLPLDRLIRLGHNTSYLCTDKAPTNRALKQQAIATYLIEKGWNRHMAADIAVHSTLKTPIRRMKKEYEFPGYHDLTDPMEITIQEYLNQYREYDDVYVERLKKIKTINPTIIDDDLVVDSQIYDDFLTGKHGPTTYIAYSRTDSYGCYVGN